MEYMLRLTGRQHAQLQTHLFPRDGNEAIAVALCGRRQGADRHCLTVRHIDLIPHVECIIRGPGSVTWPTDRLVPLLHQAAKDNLAILKIHSHRTGIESFSSSDDNADRELFNSIYSWVGHMSPHVSAIMLPDGSIFGRVIAPDGVCTPLESVFVAGDDIHFWHNTPPSDLKRTSDYLRKNEQAFGEGTIGRLRRLRVAVVGCSGTGSPVAEQLIRLGTGVVVLVDPDIVEEKNLNRILNSRMDDVRKQKHKVQTLAEAAIATELDTTVIPIARNIADPVAIEAVAGCDIVFGCMDGAEGRYLLNRLASFYLIPYFDIGVRLEADGYGGVKQVCGTVHYLQPDGSSLLSRNVITMDDVSAEALKRTDPGSYDRQVEEKYIKGVQVERPAVISVNMLFAALGVNELLARLHQFRYSGNAEFATLTMDLIDPYVTNHVDGEPCRVLAKHAGRGDTLPLLGMPGLDG